MSVPAAWRDHQPPDDGFDLYKLAVEEYRWQATYNWSRTQYLLALNAGILAAAVAVMGQGGRAAALVFGLGAVAAALSILVVETQHDYYRAARDRMRRLEKDFGVPPLARVDTTSTLGKRHRLVSVNQVTYLLFAALAVADLGGVVAALS